MIRLWTAPARLGRAVAAAWAQLRERLRPKVRVRFTDERPQRLRQYTLYVTSGAQGPTFGFLRCPCGCGGTLHLRFFGVRRPRWKLQTDARRIATLTPSVWRQTGCCSHFVLRDGKIHWR